MLPASFIFYLSCMSLLEHESIAAYRASSEEKGKRVEKQLEATEKGTPEQRERLQGALEALFPGASPKEIPALFTAYVKTLSAQPNRFARRHLEDWLEARQGKKKIQGKENEKNVNYVVQLGQYEVQRRAYNAEAKKFALAEQVYEVDKGNYDRDFARWQELKAAYDQAERGEKKVRVKKTTTVIETESVLVAPKGRERKLEQGARPGLVETAETEAAWAAMYQEAVDKLVAQSLIAKPDALDKRAEGWLTYLGRGKAAIQAFMLLVTTLLIAGPQGERVLPAGVAQAQEATPRAPKPVSRFAQEKAEMEREQSLAQAPMEQAGPHELYVRLGNGQGARERFVVAPSVTQDRVQFEVGSHYRTVTLRAGEQAEQVQQVNNLADRALHSYQLHGMNAEAAGRVIDHVTVTLTGSASLEGQKAGNVALVNQRLEVTERLIRDAFAARHIPGTLLTFHRENVGMQGNEQQMATELQAMGVHVKSGETWHSFLGHLASVERTEGMNGVHHLLASHGARNLDVARADHFFETHFRAHRAVGVEIEVGHKAVTIVGDAPAHPPEPVKVAEAKPVETTFYNDVYNPSVPERKPLGQTRGLLDKKRTRRVVNGIQVEIEEAEPEAVLPVRPERPERPLPPIPPVPPLFDVDGVTYERTEMKKGPDAIRAPEKRGGATHRKNVLNT